MSGDTDRLAQIEPDLVGATIIRLHVGREINDKERAEFEALVEIAKAARELLGDDDMPNHWDDCVCSYCVRHRALRTALSALDGDT